MRVSANIEIAVKSEGVGSCTELTSVTKDV